MEDNRNVKLHERVATNTANIENLCGKVDDIKKQVSNDIPHQIKAVDEKVDNMSATLHGKLDKFIKTNRRQFIGYLISIIIILLGIITTFIKLK